jgi:hypothetical protein
MRGFERSIAFTTKNMKRSHNKHNSNNQQDEQKPSPYNLIQKARINHLNRLLRRKQKEIALQLVDAVTSTDQMRMEVQSKLNLNDLNLTVQYYILKSSHPIHTFAQDMQLEQLEKWTKELANLSFDWKTNEIPDLEQPCCFLLAELFNNRKIAALIPDIAMIWTSVTAGIPKNNDSWRQKGKWLFVFKYDHE